ncbi:MAG: hypothetical protein HKN56_02385 [Gammaproteobacteria bacterium]|nr:hypothetical protein [Gammaproteobacteria bacterium]
MAAGFDSHDLRNLLCRGAAQTEKIKTKSRQREISRVIQLQLLHKAALYAVLSFVIVGAAISLAGPDRLSDTAKSTGKLAAPSAQNDQAMANREANTPKRNGG